MEKKITSLLLANNPGNDLKQRAKELDDKMKWLLHNNRNMDNYLELETFSKDGVLCQWIKTERARDVEHYLKNTNHTLTEVAFMTGFSSTSNLNDFCKDYLLDTPGEIRKKTQETKNCTLCTRLSYNGTDLPYSGGRFSR